MKKIGFVVNHPTQFEVPFYQWVNKNDNENEFTIFYLKGKQTEHFDDELGQNIKWGFNLFEGYPHQFLNPENPLSHFKALISSSAYDLIIVNGYKNQYAGFANICKENGVKVGLRLDTVLFNQPFWKIWLRKLLLRKEYNQFDHFLVTGKVSRDYIKAMGITSEKINLFSYCVDNEFFKNPRIQDVAILKEKFKIEDKKIILSVAKFMDRESPWDILKAFTNLNDSNLVLILVGDGEDRVKLESYANQYQKLKIIFPGYINYQELPAYYQISDLFIHAAKDEPWGVSVQEAIAGGCFVICSDMVGAAQDLIMQGRNGFTYTFGDYNQLAKYIQKGLEIDQEILAQTNQNMIDYWNYDLMWEEVKKAVVQ